MNLVEFDFGQLAGLVHRGSQAAADTGGVCRQGEQANALAATGRHDQEPGAVAVDHLAQLAIDDETFALFADAGLHGVEAIAVVAGIGEGRGQAALSQLRQPAGLLVLVASQQQCRGGQAGTGEER
ncbi:hypothetical protein D9M68_769270 [compost metagenome]